MKRREAIEVKTFKVNGTFESLYAAQRWLSEKGYEYGSLCGREPVALTKGEYNLPQKWKNFSKSDENIADGLMLSMDFREGEVNVFIFK